MNNIAATNYQHAFITKRLEQLSKLIMKLRRLPLIDTKLNNRNICIRKNMAEHCPCTMIQTPMSIKTNVKRLQEFLHTLRKFRTTRSRPGNLKKFPRKPVEIVYGFGKGTT